MDEEKREQSVIDDDNETNYRHKKATIKIAVVLTICALLIAALILTSFFVFEDYKVQVQSASFWVQKGTLAIITFLIALCVGAVVETSLYGRDNDYIDRVSALDQKYKRVNREGLADELDIYLASMNRQAKYRAYLRKLKRMYKYARRTTTRDRLKEKFLVTPDELYDSVENVRYHRVTYTSLVSGAVDVSEDCGDEDSDSDIHSHKLSRAMRTLALKILLVILFGAAAGDIFYDKVAFTSDMIIPLLFKIASILLAVASGISLGYYYVSDTKIMLRRKLRIFSKFFKRVETKYDHPVTLEERYGIPIKPDRMVQKFTAEIDAKHAKEQEQTSTIENQSGDTIAQNTEQQSV